MSSDIQSLRIIFAVIKSPEKCYMAYKGELRQDFCQNNYEGIKIFFCMDFDFCWFLFCVFAFDIFMVFVVLFCFCVFLFLCIFLFLRIIMIRSFFSKVLKGLS